MGKRRENQKRAYCYLQLCAAAAAGERPSRSCASIWHFFGAVGVEIGVGAPSGTGAGVASGCTAANGSLGLRTKIWSFGFALHVACASLYCCSGKSLWPINCPNWNDAQGAATPTTMSTVHSSALARNFLRASRRAQSDGRRVEGRRIGFEAYSFEA